MRVSNETAIRSVFVFECLGNFAPAVGLIGTLIGLIQMLGKLSDAAVVGPSMSLALIATMYGAVFANLIFFPVAGKLQAIANERAHLKMITLEGLMSLSKQESPILVQQRLQSFESVAANG
jgi:chemotaxis protein MotA